MGDEAHPMVETPDNLDAPEDEPLEASSRPDARTRALMLIAFLTLYSTACSLPAFYMQGQVLMWRGVDLMVFGAMALRHGQLGWLANLFLVATLRCAMNGQRVSVIKLSIPTLGLGLHTYALSGHEIMIGHGDFNVVRLISFGPGFYLWLASLSFPLVISEYRHWSTPSTDPQLADRLR